MELAHYVFRKSGSWTVVFDGKPAFHLEDTLERGICGEAKTQRLHCVVAKGRFFRMVPH
jgi:hypothetical protein